ncbi:MAG: ATP-binding cassette domain-containing protein [Eisenbergiella sp.]
MDIEVKEIAKIYGTGENRVTALQPASMTVREGDFLSIMGPSGSGKSTLLHIISGLDVPTTGTVTYGERTSTGNRQRVIRLPPSENRLYFPAVPPASRPDRPGKYPHAPSAGQGPPG